jgi:hypothetical protein
MVLSHAAQFVPWRGVAGNEITQARHASGVLSISGAMHTGGVAPSTVQFLVRKWLGHWFVSLLDTVREGPDGCRDQGSASLGPRQRWFEIRP